MEEGRRGSRGKVEEERKIIIRGALSLQQSIHVRKITMSSLQGDMRRARQ